MRPNPAIDPRALATFQAYAGGALIEAASKAPDPTEILIYDAIGADPWTGEGVTDKGVLAALKAAGDKPVTVRINSPGGDVFTGLAIYNALLGHAPGVNVIVDGLAASAASFIAMAGTTITMQAASMMMIHNARTMAFGDQVAMQATTDLLAKIDGQLAGIYATKSGGSLDDIAAAMTATTWYSADEAKAAALVDTVLAPPPKVAPPKAEAEPKIVAFDYGNRKNRLRLAITL